MKERAGVVIMEGVCVGHGSGSVRRSVAAFGGVGRAVGLAVCVASGCGGPDGGEGEGGGGGEGGTQEDEVAERTETETEDRACWVDDECEPGEVCEAGQCVPDPCADTGCEPEPEPCGNDDSECEEGVCLPEGVCLEVPTLPTCANAPIFSTEFPVEPQPSFLGPAFIDSDDDGADELAYYTTTDELVVVDGAASTVSLVEDEYPYPPLVPLRVDSGPLALVFGDRLLVGDGDDGFSVGGALTGGEFGLSQLPADFWGTGRQGLVSVTDDYGLNEIWAWADEGQGLAARLIAVDSEAGAVADLDGDGRDSVIVLQGDLLWEAQLVEGGWVEPAPLVTTTLTEYGLARVGLGPGEAQVVVGHEQRGGKRTVLASFLDTGIVRVMVSGGQRSSAVGDFDGDGRDELVLLDDQWPPPVYVDFDAQGVPICQSVQVAVELPTTVKRVIVGDPDGDGRDSIGVVGYSIGLEEQFWQLNPS